MPEQPQSAQRSVLAADLTRYALLVLCFYFVAAVAIAGLIRVAYPYEIHWLEGSVVDHVARVVDGDPLYTAPSTEFVPHAETPLYYWVGAGLAQVLGVGFLPLRLLSLLSALGCMALLFALVLHERASRTAALAAAAVFGACYPLTGTGFDLARSDSFGLLLLLASAALLQHGTSPRARAGAGLLAGAAFFALHALLLPVALLAVHGLTTGRGARRFVFAGVALATVAGGCALGAVWSEGWFTWYALELPPTLLSVDLDLGLLGPAAPAGGALPTDPFGREPARFWLDDVAATLPVFAVLAALLAVAAVRQRPLADPSLVATLVAGLIVPSWTLRAAGAEPIALMPAYAGIALCAGLAIHHVPRLGPAAPREQATTRIRWVSLAVHALCVVQLVALLYDPTAEAPGEVDRVEGAQRVTFMTQVEGPIWSPAAGHLPRLAGKAPSAHAAPLLDVIRAGGPVADALAARVDRALAGQRFAVIFAPIPGFEQRLLAHYQPTAMGAPSPAVRHPLGPDFARRRRIFLPRMR